LPIPVELNRPEILSDVKAAIRLPIAVKMSHYFSSFANMARALVDAGADGLVLFNRFYQPDIDPEALDIPPNVLLSTPMAMRLPSRWIAILHVGSRRIWQRRAAFIKPQMFIN
jgi:dihydroorotate dehydrogenase (fumarate)